MLSTSVIKNVDDAAHYFNEKDNYYTRDEGLDQNEWFGSGADKLGLRGQVDPKQFTEILEGKLPNGDIVGKVVDGKLQHRPGWDLTFSAPKSVSIMAFIAGDKRLIHAHREAVKAALSEVERCCSEARLKKKGEIYFENTQNITAALYHHDLSRELDPQLHTHGVIMNITERMDKLWRSQASSLGRYHKDVSTDIHGFIERVRHNKKYFGKIYEAELAHLVKQCGYEIAINPETKVFEIVGVSEEVKSFFSKRRKQITAELERSGFKGAKAAEMATLYTRKFKKEVDREALMSLWQGDAKRLGLDESLIQETKTRLQKELVEPASEFVISLIQKSAKELSQFKTSFTLDELISEIMKFSITESLSSKSLLTGIDTCIDQGVLLSLDNHQGKSFFMFKETLEHEKQIKTILNNNETVELTIQPDKINKILKKYTDISKDEKGAIHTILDNEKYVMLEGKATQETLIKPIIDIAKSHELNIHIVSPNAITSKTFATEVKDKPSTIWQHIKSLLFDTTISNESVLSFISNQDRKSPDLLLVEKSHLLSAKEQAELLTWGSQHHSKILFLSEKNHLLSQKVGVGTDLLSHGMKTIELSEKSDTRDLVLNIQKAASHISEVKDQDERLTALAKHFARLPDFKDAYLVTSNQKSVDTINQLTHEALKNENKLGKSIRVKDLIPQFISDARREDIKSYPIGSIVRFNENHKELSIKRGDYCRIDSHDQATQTLLIKNVKGKVHAVKPDFKMELFKEVEREWSVGERLQCKRSIQYLGLAKGEHLTINKINGHSVKLVRDHGKAILLDLKKSFHTHFDYGYAGTLHHLSHVKAETLLIDMPSNAFQTNQRQLTQSLSQSKNISIYTDNTVKLSKNLAEKTGDRLSAHEIFNEAVALKNHLENFYSILQDALSKQGITDKDLSKKAIDAVDYAIHHFSEREAVFTHKELMSVAIQQVLGDIKPDILKKVSQTMETAGILFRIQRNDGTFWTTVDTIKTEKEILSLAMQDKGKLQPIAESEISNQVGLSSEQKATLQSILQSQDRVLVIQGRAGTGKTTLMASLADVLTKNTDYTLQSIAPTHKAVHELKSRGIPSQTIDKFLNEMNQVQKNLDVIQSILIVDEASMVSNQKMLKILKIAHQCNFRQIILMGDKEQLPAIEAGKPHSLIQDKFSPIELKDIQRQKNSVLQEAVQAIYDHDVKKAFSALNKSVVEIKDYDQRIKNLVTDYLALSEDKRSKTQIITPSHEDRRNVNEAVRQVLNQKNVLSGESHSFSILTSKNMTATEKTYAGNFTTGDVIKFHQSIDQSIRASDYFKIKEIDQNRNLLTLNKLDGSEVTIFWQLSKTRQKKSMIEVFKEDKRNLQIGDSIHWPRSKSESGLPRSGISKVIDIQKNTITIEQSDNTRLTFNADEHKFKHWDHAYAITAHNAQGATYQNVISLFESYRKNLMSQKTFLVTLTRAKENCRIYTDDQKVLIQQIENNKGNKHSSLEMIKQGKMNEYLKYYADINRNDLLNQPSDHRARTVFQSQSLKMDDYQYSKQDFKPHQNMPTKDLTPSIQFEREL